MNPAVDRFVEKSEKWHDEIVRLRKVMLETKLREDLKWNLPCYSYDGRNIVIIQPFKACLGLMFFKGALLKDAKKALVQNGPNSRSSKRIEFRSVTEIAKMAVTLRAYVKEAIALEVSGAKVAVKKTALSIPEELRVAFVQNSRLKKAFKALTPGRQRAYLLHFTGAKRPETRQSRIKKCAPRILRGLGLTDR